MSGQVLLIPDHFLYRVRPRKARVCIHVDTGEGGGVGLWCTSTTMKSWISFQLTHMTLQNAAASVDPVVSRWNGKYNVSMYKQVYGYGGGGGIGTATAAAGLVGGGGGGTVSHKPPMAPVDKRLLDGGGGGGGGGKESSDVTETCRQSKGCVFVFVCMCIFLFEFLCFCVF